MDKEEWRSIKGFERYEVSSLGRVKSLGGGRYKVIRMMKPWSNPEGYMKVCLRNHEGRVSKMYVHILVASAFVPNPHNKPEVNHKDGVPSNCFRNNLEWVTSQENKAHARDILGAVHGKPPRAVEMLRIETMEKFVFMSIKSAARELGLIYSNIQAVLRGKRQTVSGYSARYFEGENHATNT